MTTATQNTIRFKINDRGPYAGQFVRRVGGGYDLVAVTPEVQAEVAALTDGPANDQAFAAYRERVMNLPVRADGLVELDMIASKVVR